MSRRGLAVSLLGLALAALARIAIPGAPPLYDAVVVTPPYVWLTPPQGAPGDPKGAETTIAFGSGPSPLIALATPENVPQAQIFAEGGAFTMPPGATAIHVAIDPVAPTLQPADGQIDGNVYRLTIVDGSGAPIVAPASALVTLILRSTDVNRTQATIEVDAGATWQPVQTSLQAQSGLFGAVITGGGDYAVVVAGGSASPGASGASGSPGSSAAGSAPPTAAATPPPVVGPTHRGIPPLTIIAVIAFVLLLAVPVVMQVRRSMAAGRDGTKGDQPRGWSDKPGRRRRRR